MLPPICQLDQRMKARKAGRPIAPPVAKTLAAYAATHLAAKHTEVDKHGQPITDQWLAAVQQHLDRAVMYFGKDRLLASIDRADLLRWIARLRQQFQDGAARQHLNSLSNLYRRAVADGLVAVNPVTNLLPREKPQGTGGEAECRVAARRGTALRAPVGVSADRHAVAQRRTAARGCGGWKLTTSA